MNMVFNPMSTTIGRSITLLHPEPPFSLPSTGSLEAQSGGVQRAYYTRLCVCVCVCVCVSEHVIRSCMDYAPRKSRRQTCFEKGLKLAEVVENVTAPVMSRSDDRRLTPLTNAIKKEPLCKVGISAVLTISGRKQDKLSPRAIS